MPPVFLRSTRSKSKYSTVYNGKTIHFGAREMQQYKDSTGLGLYSHMDHLDPKRRKSYLSRAKGIRNGKGEITWEDPSTANYYSVHYLW